MGLLTSIGNNKKTSWDNLINKKSGIKKIKNFDVSNLPAKIAGYVNNDSEEEHYFNEKLFLDSRDINRNDRFIQYGLVAAEMAIEDAGLKNINENDKLRTGVSVGSGIGALKQFMRIQLNNKEPKKLSPFFIPSSLVNLLSGQISINMVLKDKSFCSNSLCNRRTFNW